MPKIKANYEFMLMLLEDGWTGEEFDQNKEAMAELLLCSKFWFEHLYPSRLKVMKEFGTDFDHLWDQLQQHVRRLFIDYCLAEMGNK